MAAIGVLGTAITDLVAARPDDQTALLADLLAATHRTHTAWCLASDEMDDDLIDTDIADMDDDQLARLRQQGAVTVGLHLIHIAAQAMAHEMDDGLFEL